MSRFNKRRGGLKGPKVGTLLRVRPDLHPYNTRPAPWKDIPTVANGKLLVALSQVVRDRGYRCDKILVLDEAGMKQTLYFHDHWTTYFHYAIQEA